MSAVISLVIASLSFAFGGWQVGLLTTLFLVIFFLLGTYFPLSSQYKNYLEVNERDVFTYDSYYGKMNFCGKAGNVEFELSEIKAVTHYLSVATQNGNTGKLPWDPYGYVHFKLQDGRSFVLTSLMIPDIREFLRNSEIDRNKITEVAGWMLRLVPGPNRVNAG